eukprot:TsM_000380100 transcript=TsM_000380100 gene=TsM_000380100
MWGPEVQSRTLLQGEGSDLVACLEACLVNSCCSLLDLVKAMLYLIHHPHFDSPNNFFVILSDLAQLPTMMTRVLAGLSVKRSRFPLNAAWFEWARDNVCHLCVQKHRPHLTQNAFGKTEVVPVTDADSETDRRQLRSCQIGFRTTEALVHPKHNEQKQLRITDLPLEVALKICDFLHMEDIVTSCNTIRNWQWILPIVSALVVEPHICLPVPHHCKSASLTFLLRVIVN